MSAAGLEPGPASSAGFAAAHDVQSAHAAFRDWVFGQALPFWGAAGHDGPGGGACEHLRLDGTPADVAFKRMRVQARQIYVFSHAALLGWTEGERLAHDGYAFITRHGQRDDGSWVRTLSRMGDVVDPAADLYDLAFVLFALAWYARLTGLDEPLQRARRTLGFIESSMRFAPAGYQNVTPAEPGPRQQNPHMHLLEAMLALHETTGDERYLAVAHELVALFRERLFEPDGGTLGEFFTADWRLAPGEAGSLAEPGHHYEWVWLLDQYERRTGLSLTGQIGRLYSFARRAGADPRTGLVWDAVNRDGSARSRTSRLWPQAEALKAHIAMARRGAGGADLIVPVTRNIGTRFLAGCPPGAWIDQLDADGAPAATRIPTSSFYHLFMAYAELADYAGGLAPA